MVFPGCSPGAALAQSTTFSFTLDEPCKTSAGVYKPDGTLVRTLWSKVRYYSPGAYSAVWDGNDDNTNPAPAGQYQIKLLQHNTEYVWDGAIGNSSSAATGPTLHQGFHFIQDLAITGTNAFYDSGYDEGKYPFRSFFTTAPQQVQAAWIWNYNQQGTLGSNPVNIYDRNWGWVATDGSWVYFACSATFNPTNLVNNSYPGCIVASKVGDHSLAIFTAGGSITNGPGFAAGPLPNGIYVGAQPGLSGLAVQASGNLLAASVAPDNAVYIMDKRSGAPLLKFSVTNPGRMNFSPDNSLWVVSGTSVICFTNAGVAPAAALTVSGLSKPLDVAVNPTNANEIIIADGGSSQQVKAFDMTGAPLWTYGQAGGYQTNGPAVTTNKFWFSCEGVDETFLSYASDGSFWVGDQENHRVLHISGSGSYLEQIMYQPFSYCASMDQNNPSRVFNQFLEFQVDYTKPLSQSWTLVNNWKASADPNHVGYAEGISCVTTLANGRSYALVNNSSCQHGYLKEVCELTATGLRFTGIFPMTNSVTGWNSIAADGSARMTITGSALWYGAPLTGFDTNGNPVWGAQTVIASASQGGTDPYPRWGGFGDDPAAISSNNILISLDQSLNNGWHLGGIKVGTTNWLWKASHAGDLNGCGNYEIDNGVTYGGDTALAVGRNIVFGYHGEFFRSQSEASQHLHYYDDGLFVGEFGEASLQYNTCEFPLPGFAGNAYSPSLFQAADGDLYLWHNDESSHGPQRWHLVNARNIREQTGAGLLGGNITLTNPPVNFPAGLSIQNGNHCAGLSWQAVAGAATYDIRCSVNNGGPYNIFSGSAAATHFVALGLTNGQTYYFVVSAVQAGNEGTLSEQATASPFDTTQNAICLGAESEGGQMDLTGDIQSNAPAGQPAYLGAEYATGVLNLRERDYYGFGQLADETIGTKGFVIYDWGGPGTNLVNVSSNFTVLPATGWKDISYLKRYYRVNTNLGAAFDTQAGQNGIANGITAHPVGVIPIVSNDTNFHYLTVFSPACFNASRNAKLGVTPASGASVYYLINENPGYSHVYQFAFRGNISLWADATAGASMGYGGGGIVQAIFLDDAPVTIPSSLRPPSGFHVTP